MSKRLDVDAYKRGNWGSERVSACSRSHSEVSERQAFKRSSDSHTLLPSSTEPLLSKQSSEVTALYMPTNLKPRNFNSSLLASEWSPKLFGLGTQGLSDGVLVYCLNLISYDFLQQNLSYSHTELLTIHFAYADFPMSGLCLSLNSLLFPILQGSNQRLYVSQSL